MNDTYNIMSKFLLDNIYYIVYYIFLNVMRNYCASSRLINKTDNLVYYLNVTFSVYMYVRVIEINR